MQNSIFGSHQRIPTACVVFALAAAIAIPPAAAEETAERVDKSVATLDTLTGAHEMRADEVAMADCIAIIPGFKKGAAVVGVSFGRGFISCRDGQNWSAPAAVTLEGGSLGVQFGGEKIDLVILSIDRQYRSKLLSDRFRIGSDASAAWGNGKTAHANSDEKILCFGHTKGAFAGFDLDGTSLKPDDSGNKALYGKSMTNSQIVEGATTPPTAQPLISRLNSLVQREFDTTSGLHTAP